MLIGGTKHLQYNLLTFNCKHKNYYYYLNYSIENNEYLKRVSHTFSVYKNHSILALSTDDYLITPSYKK